MVPSGAGNETSRPEKANVEATEGTQKEENIGEAEFDEENKDQVLIADNEPKSDSKRPSAIDLNDLPVKSKTDQSGEPSPYIRGGLDEVAVFKPGKT